MWMVGTFAEGFIPLLVLLLVSLLLFGLGCILFQAFSILWAPVAAIICAVSAYRANRSIWRYAIAGALASIFLFVPWVHLMRGLRNKPISGTIFGDAIKIMYGLWAVWIVTQTASALIFMSFLLGDISFILEDLSWSYFERLILSPFGLIPVLAIMGWIISRRIVFQELVSECEKAEDIWLLDLPQRLKIMYILPFASASANILSIPAYIVILLAIS